MKRIPIMVAAAALAVATWSANTSCGNDAVGLSTEEQVQFDQLKSDVAQLKTTAEKLQTDLDALKKTATDKKLSEATGTLPDLEKTVSTLKGSLTQFNVKVSSNKTSLGQSVITTSDGLLSIWCGTDGAGSLELTGLTITGTCSGNSFTGSETTTSTFGASSTLCAGTATDKLSGTVTWTDTTVSGSVTDEYSENWTTSGCKATSSTDTIQITGGTRIKRIIRR